MRSNVADRFPLSTAVFQLKCESGEPPRILAEGALRLWKEPIERVVRVAQPELDRLHRIVDHAGDVTLLCETRGAA